MEFQTVSHACMVARHDGVELVIDPWLVGSCYWRSWWNMPEPPQDVVASLRPDFIYLTHLHWDHFHGPSLRRFAPSARVLVPKLPTTRRMVEDLRYLGFREIIEIAHGQTLALSDAFRVTSYQSGVSSDSILVMRAGDTTIVDANDCKLFGHALRQVADRFPDIDFVLRSHSSATPIPYCLDSYPARFGRVRTPHDYAEEFARFAFALNARYAVPFASNHCYLHRDTMRFNALATDPQRVHDFTNAESERLQLRTRSVLMAAGSRWSDRDGFALKRFDYERREQHIDALSNKHRPALERSYDDDAACDADIAAAHSYFAQLFSNLPPAWMSRRWLGFRIVMEVAGRTTHRFLIDFGARTLTVDPELDDTLTVIRTPARVWNDCCRLHMFSTWSASKRLGIAVPEHADLTALSRFLTVLDLHELGQLPLHKNFSPRALEQRLRRWREPLDLLSYLWQSRTRKNFRVSDLYPLPAPAGARGLERRPGTTELESPPLAAAR